MSKGAAAGESDLQKAFNFTQMAKGFGSTSVVAFGFNYLWHKDHEIKHSAKWAAIAGLLAAGTQVLVNWQKPEHLTKEAGFLGPISCESMAVSAVAVALTAERTGSYPGGALLAQMLLTAGAYGYFVENLTLKGKPGP